MTTLTQEIVDWLKEKALEKTCEDQSKEDGYEIFDPDDFACGDVDNAYYNGLDDGIIEMSRELLKRLKI